MGLIISVILAVISYFVAKGFASSKPEVADWSVNKKQALSLAWFAMCVLIFTLIKVAIQPGEDLAQQIFGSVGISIVFGMIFYQGLKPKKQTA